MARNIHQNKRIKSHKPAATVAEPVAAAQPLAAAPAKTAPVKAAQLPASVRFAELPHELRRIGLFFAFVVVLLLVLWFFLK